MRTLHIVLLVILGAVIGFSIFGVLVWQAVETEKTDATEALRRFSAARATFESMEPMLDLDSKGRLIGRQLDPDSTPKKLDQLRVLVYTASQERLVAADVPFWFVKLKGPALQFVLRETGFDLKSLGITPRDLERRGPGLILDESTPNGDRLLVWTE